MLDSSYAHRPSNWQEEVRLYYWRTLILCMRGIGSMHRNYNILRANWRTLVIAFVAGLALGLAREIILYVW